MKHGLKSLLIALIVAVLTIQTGCSFSTANDYFGEGSSEFSADKEIEEYTLPSPDKLLQELIDNFSGSYKEPTGTQLEDDDYDDMQDEIERARDEDEDEDDDNNNNNGTQKDDDDDNEEEDNGGQRVATDDNVSSDDDLMRLFRTAYSDTSEYVTFTLSSGYSFGGDIFAKLNYIYRELQREDPIAIACLEGWQYGSQGNSYSVKINYAMDIPTVRQIKNATPALVDAAVSQINTSGKSDYELVCDVNNYLCNTVYYPPQEPYAAVTHTPYGAFNDGCAVCEGYACAAKLMLNKMGIECDIEVGICTNGGGHAWNLVKLDGSWYQLDVTWNDCSGVLDEYLLVTDDKMRESRTWDYGNYPKTPSQRYSP